MYPTPLRQGKVLLFYNLDENILQFSKNKGERNSDDDFGLYSNRKYAFKLAYDERVVDVKWIVTANASMGDGSPRGGKHGSPARGSRTNNFEDLGSASKSKLSSTGSLSSSSTFKAVIVTNQRIYIVDKHLSIIQNFNLVSH